MIVMAGLVPAIHVFLCGQDVDARIRGHDGKWIVGSANVLPTLRFAIHRESSPVLQNVQTVTGSLLDNRAAVSAGWMGGMVESEVVAFVDELETLGVRFTVIPRLDGSLHLSCWRLQNAWNNRESINRLLAQHVERSPQNAAQIADFIKQRTSSAASAAE
jgi:hypothetical protein